MDFVSYNRYEHLACQDLHSWLVKRAHGLHVFERVGFPVRMESIDDLKMILDTMHDNRIQTFLRELNGVGEDDLKSLRRALKDYLLFFGRTFASPNAILPVSTLLAHHVVARKLLRLAKAMQVQRPRILEIGPGCGYLAFFLSQWSDLGAYAQIESAPSFYVLQHWINKHLFGAEFLELANPELGASKDHPAFAFLDTLPQFERPYFTQVRTSARCLHFPWWRIKHAAEHQFDIVVSNANLNEFSNEAFVQYAQLAYNCLTPHGMFFAQCFGGGHSTTENYHEGMDRIFGYLYELGFAPLFLTLGPLGHQPVASDRPIASALNQLHFALPNVILIKRSHPLFEHCKQSSFSFPVIPEAPALLEIFSPNQSADSRMMSDGELVRTVIPPEAQVIE